MRLVALAVVLFASSASAASYVDAPTIGRTTTGLALYGGAPIGSSHGDDRASVLGGGGTELSYGYAWESGWSLAGVFGGARWSSRGPLSQTLRDRDASITEGYAGVSARVVLGESTVAPFACGMLLLDYARVSGAQSGDAAGLASVGRAGLRMREHPWDLFAAIELRHARLSAPYDGSDPLVTTRLSIVLGFAVEGAAQ